MFHFKEQEQKTIGQRMDKQYISSRTSYGKISKLAEIESHNQRLMEVKTLLIDKINAHNDNLQDKDRYFREINDYKIMQNLSHSFGSNENQNLTQSFNEFYHEMELVYKKKKQHLYKDRGNHILEQVVSLSHKQAKEILEYEDGDRLLLEYFKEMAIAVQKKYGLEPIHIDMHLDEGYIKNLKNSMGVIESSEVVENIHAHIVFLNYNFAEQKTVLRYLKKQDFRDMQDLSAKVFQDLGFVRGEDKRNSNQTHLKTTAYVQEQQNIESEKYVVNKVDSNIEDMEYNLEDLKDIQISKEEVSDELVGLYESKKEYEKLEDLKNQEISINTTINEYEQIIQNLKGSKKDITALDISNQEKKKLHKAKQAEIKKYQGLRRDLKSEIKSLNQAYKQQMDGLKTLNEAITEKEKTLQQLQKNEAKIKHTEQLNRQQLKKEHFKLFQPILSKIKDTPTFNKDIFIKEKIKPLLYKVLEEATDTTLTLNDIKTLENTIIEMETEHKEEIKKLTINKDKEIQEKTTYLTKMHTKEINTQNDNFSTKLQSEQKTKNLYLQERNTLQEEVQESRTNNHKLRKKVDSLENEIKVKNTIIDSLHTKISKLVKIGKKIYDRFRSIRKNMKIATEIIPNIKELIQVKIDFIQNQEKKENTPRITPTKGIRI